jgi:hypothetical protein
LHSLTFTVGAMPSDAALALLLALGFLGVGRMLPALE